MPSSSRTPDPLVVLALGTFHATALLVVLLAFGEGANALGGLAALNTAVGFLVFGWLWAVAAWATRGALRAVDLDALRAGAALGAAFRWGGAAGAAFVAAAALVGFAFVREPELLFVAFFGTLVGTVAGAIVGFAFAALDLAAFAWAKRLADRSV